MLGWREIYAFIQKFTQNDVYVPISGRKIGFIFGIPFSVSKNDKAVM